ncbi:MAG: HAMP domain-containing sensor histidine kinase, partial [Clostridia bacterium]|nr:HAMP domain-containing sensor histidine kinase [Clostridia bacterium]
AELDSDAASERIYNFCIQNRTAAVLMTGDETASFGELGQLSEREDSFTMTVMLQFVDRPQESLLTIVALASTAAEIRGAFLRLLPLVAALIALISAVSAWLCSRVIARPVLRISGVSRRMAKLDMTWRCDVNRTDELGVLAASLNTLSDRLTKALGDLEAANAQLRADIESVNALERQRRDFFAAASHELKTPLTILRGQVESMMLGIGRYKDVQAVLPETLAELSRMEALVGEILALSKMELDGLNTCAERISVADALDRALDGLMPLASERRMAVHRDLGEAWITGSEALFEKALHNVLSNAIRHSPEGAEVWVTLSAERLTVRNSGITLPEAEIPALFAPFSRVEKSRSKATGGSGLGLYLVRTILELHGLTFALHNAENGVEFNIELQSKKGSEG